MPEIHTFDTSFKPVAIDTENIKVFGISFNELMPIALGLRKSRLKHMTDDIEIYYVPKSQPTQENPLQSDAIIDLGAISKRWVDARNAFQAFLRGDSFDTQAGVQEALGWTLETIPCCVARIRQLEDRNRQLVAALEKYREGAKNGYLYDHGDCADAALAAAEAQASAAAGRGGP